MRPYEVARPAAAEHGTLLSGGGGASPLDVHPMEILDHFSRSGLILFRGFDVDLDRFRRLTESLTGGFLSYEGGAAARGIVGGDPTLMTVTEATHRHPVPLHGEMYYSSRTPAVLWFYCARPASEGGETTVGDGVWIHDHLDETTRRLFEQKRIRYIMRFPEGRWQEIFRTEDLDQARRRGERNGYEMRLDEEDGSVVAEYVTRAIRRTRQGISSCFINNVFAVTRLEQAGIEARKVRLEDGSALPGEVLEELWELERRATREVAWRAGDILMVDNSRFLHGRREFTDLRREIYVRLAAEVGS